MNSTTTQNMCLGVSKTPTTKDHYLARLGATLHRRNGPGQSCKHQTQTRTQRDHQSDTLIRRPCSTQHPKCTIFRISSHASQQERIKSAQDHGLAPHSTSEQRVVHAM